MNVLHAVVLMLPVIIPVLLGFILGRARILKRGSADVLLRFLLYIAFPGVILGNLTREHSGPLLQMNYVFATIVATLGMFGFTYVIHRMFFHKNMKFTAMAALSTSFVSAGIVGIPIMDDIIGIKTTLIPVILNTMVALVTVVPLTILLIRLHDGHRDGLLKTLGYIMLDALKNPLVASSLIGLFIVFAGITLPGWLTVTFSKLGSATFATALVTVGLGINFKTFQRDLDEILFLTILRMVVFSVFGFCIAILFNLPPQLAVPFVMIMSLPTAKSVPAIGETYKGVFVSESMQIVTLTTLLTVVVMPFVVIFANQIWPGIVR